MMTDKQKKEQFDKLWENKIRESKYDFVEYFEFYSNRQVRIGDRVRMHVYDDNRYVEAIIIDKPYYIDRYNKARYRGFLIARDADGDIIFTHLRFIVKVIR